MGVYGKGHWGVRFLRRSMCAEGVSCERRWVGWVASGNRDCQWATKNSYSNIIRVGYDRIEQIREGLSGTG